MIFASRNFQFITVERRVSPDLLIIKSIMLAKIFY